MALIAKKGSDEVVAALIRALNDSRRSTAFVSTFFHADATALKPTGSFQDPLTFGVTAFSVASASASNAATLLTRTLELKALYARHVADKIGHKVADTANVVSAATPTDTTTCITFLNELKADYNTHRASTTYHYNADSTNTITSADATDEASAITLCNEIATDLVAHVVSAPGGYSIEVV